MGITRENEKKKKKGGENGRKNKKGKKKGEMREIKLEWEGKMG